MRLLPAALIVLCTAAYSAADKSDPAGLLNLGMCYATGRGVTADRSVAIIYLTRAANSGNPNQRDQAINLLKQLGVQ